LLTSSFSLCNSLLKPCLTRMIFLHSITYFYDQRQHCIDQNKRRGIEGTENNQHARLCLPKGGKRMKTTDLRVSSSLCYGNRLVSGTSRLSARLSSSYPLPHLMICRVWTVCGLVCGISIRDFFVFLRWFPTSTLTYKSKFTFKHARAFMICLLNIGD
jgi:hypothetical protein